MRVPNAPCDESMAWCIALDRKKLPAALPLSPGQRPQSESACSCSKALDKPIGKTAAITSDNSRSQFDGGAKLIRNRPCWAVGFPHQFESSLLASRAVSLVASPADSTSRPMPSMVLQAESAIPTPRTIITIAINKYELYGIYIFISISFLFSINRFNYLKFKKN